MYDMIQQLDIESFLNRSLNHLIIDVRSEGEYHYGHIPQATNLPLFDNEERKTVGTLYKQQGRNEAILAGLDIVGKKMSGFIRFIQPLIKDNQVYVHCWRGGMRSSSMAWLFNNFGYEVGVLKGGYKAYRHFVLQQLARNYKMIVIGGRTGSGKTELLHTLKAMGEQIIDLESLANHKGSAFGALGMPPQPTTEHFENMLAEELAKTDSEKRLWVEDESKNIGQVFLDLHLWNNMRSSPVFAIELPLQTRLQKLVSTYSKNEKEALEQSITTIKKRLGNEQWKMAVDALHAGDFVKVAELTLYYYDKAYNKGLSMRDGQEITRFIFENETIDTIARTLIQAADKKGL
jgi:tRNA 2-selenouridine synthase